MGFNIGNVEIKNNIVLAPMAGVSDPAYMKIVEEMGVGLVYTELLSSEAIVRNNKKTFDMLKGLEKINIPVSVQIFGSDPSNMAKAAQVLVEKYNVKIIDINMGCPVPKVAVKSEAGSSLLKNPKKVQDIVLKVCKAVSVPVTVKIRSGWDIENINAVEIAKICEKAGASAIAIHARTRSQGYTGQADWNIIKAVKESVNIPVIGNGDVKSIQDYLKMINETGCDAVMIGRAALGNPWIFKEIIYYVENGVFLEKPHFDEKLNMIKKHYELLLKNKGEKLAILEIRSHVLWYLKGLPNSALIKNKICMSKSSEDIFNILDMYKNTCS